MVLQIWCMLLLFECQVSDIVWQVKILCVSSWKKTVTTLKVLVPKYYIFVPFKRCCCNSDSFCTFFSESVPNIGSSYCFFCTLTCTVLCGFMANPSQYVLRWFASLQYKSLKIYSCLLTANDLLFQLQCFQMTHAYISRRLSRWGFAPSTSHNSSCCYS